MSYLRTFAPWIIYAVVPDRYWMWAALAALIVSLVGIARNVRDGRPADAQLIDIGSALFFAGMTIWGFTDPHTALHPYAPAISSGILALIAGVSIAVREPFTLAIAKQEVPQEQWSSPLFVRTGYILTSAWFASFVIGCVLMIALAHDSTPRIVVQVLAFALPATFTVRYAAHIKAKARALGGQAAAS
ncbi:hypothetical protein [Nocardia alni]|uniref:hypothetical protein n=1 Tax=Nocardia alni TaxID=2815723 RepID=UPI001C213B2B|nr:hypothetical protein [Nocardia alni]